MLGLDAIHTSAQDATNKIRDATLGFSRRSPILVIDIFLIQAFIYCAIEYASQEVGEKILPML